MIISSKDIKDIAANNKITWSSDGGKAFFDTGAFMNGAVFSSVMPEGKQFDEEKARSILKANAYSLVEIIKNLPEKEVETND